MSKEPLHGDGGMELQQNYKEQEIAGGDFYMMPTLTLGKQKQEKTRTTYSVSESAVLSRK